MSCLTSSYGFCACWYNLCFFPKPWHWEHFTAFFRPWQNAVESLRLTWWNVFVTELLTRNESRPCFPTHCHQFSLPSLEKNHPIISSQWGIPTSSPRSSRVEQTLLVTHWNNSAQSWELQMFILKRSKQTVLGRQKGIVFEEQGWLLCFLTR